MRSRGSCREGPNTITEYRLYRQKLAFVFLAPSSPVSFAVRDGETGTGACKSASKVWGVASAGFLNDSATATGSLQH